MAQIKILTMWNHGEAVEQYKLSSAADKIAKWRPGESQAVRILPHKPEDQTLEPQDPHKKSGVVVCVYNPIARRAERGGSLDITGLSS